MLRAGTRPTIRFAQSEAPQRRSLRADKPAQLTWRGWWDRLDATAGYVATAQPHPSRRSHTRSALLLPMRADSLANSPARGGMHPALLFCLLCRKGQCRARSTIVDSWGSAAVRAAAIAALCRIV